MENSAASLLSTADFEGTVAALTREFKGIFGSETISRFVRDALDRWPHATVTNHLPVLAHRFARERLRALGQAEGAIAKEHAEVLFVCVRNAGRSQMAAGLLAKHAKGRVHVRSAGSTPAEEINPALVATALAIQGALIRLASMTTAAAQVLIVGNGQNWSTWWWVCIVCLLLFLPSILMLAGGWGPARAKARLAS